MHMLGIKTLSKTLEYDGSYVKIIMENFGTKSDISRKRKEKEI